MPDPGPSSTRGPATPPRPRARGAWKRDRRESAGFLLATLLVLGTAIYTQANLLFWLFGLAVGAAVFALAHGWLAMRGLEADRDPPGRCAAGETLSLTYRLRNRGWLTGYSLRIRELGPPAGAGRTETRRSRPRTCPGRGSPR